MMNSEIAKYLMIGGLVLFLIGLVWYFFGDKLHFIGKLPGDLNYEGDNVKVFFPITTMILLSILASFVLHLFRKFF